LSNNAQYRDAVKIKEAGFDYVRLSHYPHSPAFLDACDEMGLITINPILGWQYYNPDPAFSEYIFKAARDLIRRDRNHPSVLAWELSLNESFMPEAFIDTLIQIAREEYPLEQCYTAGWVEYGYDIYLQARQHRIGHDAHYPDKPYVVSEYGDWEYYAMNAGLEQDQWNNLMPEQRSSRQLIGEHDAQLQQQALNIQEAHNDNYDTPAFADGYWVMFDYNRGYADDLEASGVMSIFRQPKFSYYFFRSQRDADEEIMGKPVGPMVYIASRLMEETPGSIKVFSNCEEVELFWNGKSIGRQKPDTDRNAVNLPHPPFTFTVPDVPAEEVIAIGILGGEERTRQILRKPGPAARIILSVDSSGKALEAGCYDVVFIHAEVVDEEGSLVTGYKEDISFSVTGAGDILGNQTIKPDAGLAVILLQADNKEGELIIEAASGSLAGGRLTLEIL
ncbi:glycoside hydrolase family 2 TIM barrel-domain containing protein, partial [Bacteroidota bacterium]